MESRKSGMEIHEHMRRVPFEVGTGMLTLAKHFYNFTIFSIANMYIVIHHPQPFDAVPYMLPKFKTPP